MHRLFALIVAALVLASCGSTSVLSRPDRSPLAARVGDVEISQAEVLDDASRLSELSDQFALQFPTDGSGTYSTEFLAAILTDRILSAAVQELVDREGVEVTPDDVQQAQQSVTQQLTDVDPTTGQPVPGSGEQRLADLPADYVDRTVADLANQIALTNAFTERQAAPDEVTDEQVQDYFDANEDALVETCASHILISTETRSPEEAEALAADLAGQLDEGADFAELATENSDDPGSAQQGGELGCAPRGTYVQEFDDAVWSQPVGEVGDPVETDFGVHLILVTERHDTLDALRDDIESALLAEAAQQSQADLQTELQAALEAVVDDLEIEVDARYGTWDPDTLSVVPPEGPVVATTSTTVPPFLELPPEAVPPSG